MQCRHILLAFPLQPLVPHGGVVLLHPLAQHAGAELQVLVLAVQHCVGMVERRLAWRAARRRRRDQLLLGRLKVGRPLAVRQALPALRPVVGLVAEGLDEGVLLLLVRPGRRGNRVLD